MSRKLLLLLGFFLLAGAVVVAQVLKVKMGYGAAVVLAPPGHALSVAIDGGAPAQIPAGAYRRFTLKQGIHSFAITDATTGQTALRTLDSNAGNSHKLVSASDDQCFVSLDIALSHYRVGKAAGPAPLPHVNQRFKNTKVPFELYRGNYLSEKELPKSVQSTAPVYLLHSLPCAELDRPDRDLVVWLGY